MTLKLNAHTGGLLFFGVVHAPLEGLRLSDLEKLEELKKALRLEGVNGEEKEVEIPDRLMPLLKACWEGLPVGRLPRGDDLPVLVKQVQEQLSAAS